MARATPSPRRQAEPGSSLLAPAQPERLGLLLVGVVCGLPACSTDAMRSDPDERNRRGREAEALAAGHLRAMGWELLDRNHRCERGEVDLVFRVGAELRFVEVRSRTGDEQGTPEETVGPRKARRVVAAALDWAQAVNPEARACWIAGVSFGSWIGMQLLMRRPEIEGFVSVAPPANRFDFSFLAPCPSSGLFIHGDQDRVAPLKEVTGLIEKLKTQKGIVIEHAVVEGANHFFENRVEPLIAHVDAYLDRRLGNPPRIPIPARGD